MEGGNNNLLAAVALLEGVTGQLKCGKRDQISRVTLSGLERTLAQILNKLNQITLFDTSLLGYLVTCIECIHAALGDEFYHETDTETKEIIMKKVMECLGHLYLEAGRYYTENHFNYSIKLEQLLERIVLHCIEEQYFFGIM